MAVHLINGRWAGANGDANERGTMRWFAPAMRLTSGAAGMAARIEGRAMMDRTGRLGRMPGRVWAAAGVGLALAGREAVGRLREADLAGEVALVTGGSRGFGLALARELAGEGCRLAICARDGDELERARAELAGAGAEVLALTCDLRDREQVAAMIGQIVAHYGRLDILVNNAGIIAVAPVENLTAEEFERVMAIDFWGTLNPTLAALPGMRARGSGRIVNITSLGGKIAVPHMLPYASAKFAAVGFSEGLRAEVANDGITVTTVVPGEMRTGSHLRAEFGGDEEAEYRWFALGASLPLTMRADRAARLVVRGIKRGRAEVTYPFSAVVAARLNGVAPAWAARVMQVMDRALPGSEPGKVGGLTSGAAVDEKISSPAWEKATTLGEEAAQAFNQHPIPEPTPTSGEAAQH